MAFVANYNPLDDETETTGSTTGQNQNTPSIISPLANADSNDANATLTQNDPNATKGSGFTNLQRYLSANQTGGANLGTQVASKIDQETADPFNPDTGADLASTAAGQSQLLKSQTPSLAAGGTTLNQFLMNQGGGLGAVNAAADRQRQEQQNAYLRDIESNNGVQTYFASNPNTTTNWGGSTGGASPSMNAGVGMPNLSDYQNSFISNPGNTANSTIGAGLGAFGTGSTGGSTSGTTTPTTPTAPSGTTGGSTGGTSGSTTTAPVTGGSTGGDTSGSGGSGNGEGPSGSYTGNYTIGADGTATADVIGVDSTIINTIGGILSKITGIPLIGFGLNQLVNYVNGQNQSAAEAYNKQQLANSEVTIAQETLGPYGGYTTGSTTNAGTAGGDMQLAYNQAQAAQDALGAYGGYTTGSTTNAGSVGAAIQDANNAIQANAPDQTDAESNRLGLPTSNVTTTNPDSLNYQPVAGNWWDSAEGVAQHNAELAAQQAAMQQQFDANQAQVNQNAITQLTKEASASGLTPDQQDAAAKAYSDAIAAGQTTFAAQSIALQTIEQQQAQNDAAAVSKAAADAAAASLSAAQQQEAIAAAQNVIASGGTSFDAAQAASSYINDTAAMNQAYSEAATAQSSLGSYGGYTTGSSENAGGSGYSYGYTGGNVNNYSDAETAQSSLGSYGGYTTGSTTDSSSSDSDSSGSSGGGSSGGGGSSSSRVICTHFYRKGEMNHDDWRNDLEYTAKHLSAQTVRGYQYWAIPYVKLMRKSKLAENIMRPIAINRAEELSYQMGKRTKGNMIGKLVRVVMEPMCWAIGAFVPEQNWQQLYTPGEKA